MFCFSTCDRFLFIKFYNRVKICQDLESRFVTAFIVLNIWRYLFDADESSIGQGWPRLPFWLKNGKKPVKISTR